MLISASDSVLECACGTGLLSKVIAPRCKTLIATDFSANMLKIARRKCKNFPNAEFKQENIMHLGYSDASFDAVVAANVIHLLDEPYTALGELYRVCRKGGKIVIPTYINKTDNGGSNILSGALANLGVAFKREFTLDSYKEFFADAGYRNVRYILCSGKIPCAIAVIEK